MPTSHDLSGLMKFLRRDEWRECFEGVFNEHFGPILDESEEEFEDLAEVLGDYWTNTLWGCVFEDFLTQDFEGEPTNVVDEYLKRRGWKERAQSRAYMAALRTSVMSLYEVSNVVPGVSFMARDLIRGGEPMAVSEGTATKTLRQWDRLAARIVPVMGENVMSGGVLPFTPQATETLFEGLQGLFGKRNTKKLPAIKDDELQAAAFMFTLSWLFDTLGRVAEPRLQNTDGDEIVFHNVRFPIAPGVKQEGIAARLNNIPALSQADAKFWNWLEETPKGRDKSKAATAPAIDTTMDNGPLVLGNVELKGRFLHLSTNSAARATRGTALIQQALGDLVRTPLTEITTVEQMKAGRPRKGAETSPSNVPPEVAEQEIRKYLDRHYLETLDQPVKMLGNKTPRQAAKTTSGRQKVADWLKYLENQTAKQPDPRHPMATYSFEWMWKELGVHDLRR
ncbi:hypothetical protein RFM26_01755 [Mesorhizobium sp. VK23B]|uniref:DUF2384 domain-containing protein n=1 Tax=Mesorhizobium dulcispinae TaxID=3072316 RepID=A0ABU4XAK7_9HYPH|nr:MULTISPECIES: hypothetical protein [unclassified Mesorhizobium]MDX8464409.1 hypothetical protein [Mesorhizobium sp. VK23B]MDX8470795.1 hypothetical protein [Mesorhizobium sp. VK23A]MDX8517699.1 hypothetical protein [Mesorhizobium sp. VK23D]